MSIVRIGLAETKHFAEGYSAIFGKKKKDEHDKATESKKESGKKSAKAGKKKAKK